MDETVTANQQAISPDARMAASPALTAPATYQSIHDFVANHRIYVEDGALFLPDQNLSVHSRELALENRQQLATKLVRQFSLPLPSFFSPPAREQVALALGSFIPLPQDARRAQINLDIKEFNESLSAGQHPKDAKQQSRYDTPMTRLIEEDLEKTKKKFAAESPLLASEYEQAMAAYLLVNLGLEKQGRPQEALHYVSFFRSPDAILSDLAPKLNITPAQYREAARQGLDGIGQLLGIDRQTVQDVKDLAAMAKEQYYSQNLVVSWDIGRRQPDAASLPLTEKIARGLIDRARSTLGQLLQRSAAIVPADVLRDENTVLSMIGELPPIMQKALFYTGTEMVFTKGPGVFRYLPGTPGLLGYNMHIPFERGGEEGYRQIVSSNLDNPREGRATFHHEVTHHFFPQRLNEQEIGQFDLLYKDGVARLKQLKAVCDAWYDAKNPDTKKAAEDALRSRFNLGQLTAEKALGLNGENPVSIMSLRDVVHQALAQLDPDSPRLSKNYVSPQSRAAEVLSRYSEMEFVSMKDQPALLAFIAPNFAHAYHQLYLPHVERQVAKLEAEQQQLPPAQRFMGLPASVQLEPLVSRINQTASTPVLAQQSTTSEVEGKMEPVGTSTPKPLVTDTTYLHPLQPHAMPELAIR